MSNSDAVQHLAAHIRATLGPGPYEPAPGWDHMGAVLCDGVVQAGLNYEHVVRPRVAKLREEWPDAATVPGFVRCLAEGELGVALDLRNARKLATIAALAAHLDAEGVVTVEDFRTWIVDDTNRAGLLVVQGVGPKTIDYLPSLVGVPSVAIDVHMRRFAREAGVDVGETYEAVRSLYEQVAVELDVDRGGLDYVVWQHMSGRRRRTAVGPGPVGTP